MPAGPVFPDNYVPGPGLMLAVGELPLTVTVLHRRRHQRAWTGSACAGLAIIGFEAVEIVITGSPAGSARNLQIYHLGLGALPVALARLSRVRTQTV